MPKLKSSWKWGEQAIVKAKFDVPLVNGSYYILGSDLDHDDTVYAIYLDGNNNFENGSFVNFEKCDQSINDYMYLDGLVASWDKSYKVESVAELRKRIKAEKEKFILQEAAIQKELEEKLRLEEEISQKKGLRRPNF